MKKNTVKVLIYFLIEIIYTLLIGGYFFYVQENYGMDTIYTWPLFYILLLGLLILIWFIGPMLNRYIVYIYSFLYGIYLISQNIYYRAFGQYYRFNTVLSLYEEAAGAKDSAMEFITINDLAPLIYLTIVTIIFIILYFTLQRHAFKLRWRLIYKAAVLLLIIPIMGEWQSYNSYLDDALHQEDVFQMNKTDYYIYETIPSTNQFVEKFGLLPFGLRDGISLMETDILGQEDFEEVRIFLNNRYEHQENDMTGIFAGKNLFIIQAESFIDAAIDERLTPTLYKLKNEGININGFDTPMLVGSTSDTEFMANTSIIPNSEGYAICYKYPFNNYVTTLPKLFNEIGYNTVAYHNNYGEYYNRDVVFPSWGYKSFVDCTGLGLEDSQADSTVLDILKWIYVETNNPYMVYWVTYSGHQPYSLDSVGVSDEHVAEIKSLYPSLDDAYVSYLAKNMDLDESLGNFMNELAKAGKLDDTVFVFFGDHMVKGLDFDASSFYDGTNQGVDTAKKATDLIIYNSATEALTYHKTATALDILPTLANMWGIEVDYHTILGSDIFDENYHGFYFSDWGIIKTDDFTYDYIYDTLTLNSYIDENEANDMADYYLNMKEIAKKLLKLDYFGEDE